MVFLYILLGLILLMTLILLISPVIRIKTDDGMTVSLRILFLSFKLLPQKKKTPKLSDFKIKKFRKNRLKEEKALRKKNKKKKKQAETKEKTKEEKIPVKDQLQYYLELIKKVLGRALSKFGRYLKIKIRSVNIAVGGNEPDKTAISYGYAVALALYLKELADNNLNVKYLPREGGTVYVGVDFLAEKTVADIDIELKISVWQILAVLMTALKAYIFDMPKSPKSKSKEKTKKKNTDKQPSAKNKKTKIPEKTGTEE